ncbi:MAG: 4'-phosphopantetheinyl transferase superfamily protein [Myxococcota bacterium]|nr:4'-phosphopantetheinyl transferase superfamily protein [Myxococcota bacterium]
MVGNDVVDLRDPESAPETLHPRFDTRVFSEREREAMAESRDAARLRWKFWAAKEAAYKLARKASPTTIFAPAKFEVALSDPDTGCVRHEAAQYCVAFTENEGALHAVATRADAEKGEVLAGWRQLTKGEIERGDPEAPSRAVRELLCERLAARLGVSADELEVRRRGRVPFLWLRGRPAPIDLSLSHHGGWLAFACEFVGTPELFADDFDPMEASPS